jgi:hypothetical protein
MNAQQMSECYGLNTQQGLRLIDLLDGEIDLDLPADDDEGEDDTAHFLTSK